MDILSKICEKVNLGKMLLLEVTPVAEYVDGKATDNVTGYKYLCVAPNMSFAHVGIKIPGAALMETPAQPVNVVFDGLIGRPYVNSSTNRPEISFKATGIRTVKD